MDKSKYGLDGDEPWEIFDTKEKLVAFLIRFHLTFNSGEIKPPELISEYFNQHSALVNDVIKQIEKWRNENEN